MTAAAMCALGCGSDGGSTQAQADAGGGGGVADAAAATADAAPAAEMESEPNNGATVDEFNSLTLGTEMQGAIGTAGDSDVFRFDADPGSVYEVRLTAGDGSPLALHLTAIDAGRDGSAAGNDYVKIDIPSSGDAELQLLAMGQGGYFAIVRDARNVGSAGIEGSPAHTYSLMVTKQLAPSIAPLTFPSTNNDSLPSPGGVKLYSFSGTAGTDVIMDMQATGDVDGRLTLYSQMTGDWIARNDDRGLGDPNPVIDAPLTAGGDMILAVENIEPSAQNLDFQLSSSTP